MVSYGSYFSKLMTQSNSSGINNNNMSGNEINWQSSNTAIVPEIWCTESLDIASSDYQWTEIHCYVTFLNAASVIVFYLYMSLSLKLTFRKYPAIHNIYIISHCTTLKYNHNI